MPVQSLGKSFFGQCGLDLLELLLSIEETTVREAASVSAHTIFDQLSDDIHAEQLVDSAAMVARLAEKEWFTTRISAAGLIAAAYPRLQTPEQHQAHLDLFSCLCRDDTLMVR